MHKESNRTFCKSYFVFGNSSFLKININSDLRIKIEGVGGAVFWVPCREDSLPFLFVVNDDSSSCWFFGLFLT